MGVFDDVKAIQDLELRGATAVDEAKPLMEWGRAAMKLAADLRAEVEKDPSVLPDAASRASMVIRSGLLDTSPTANPSNALRDPVRKTRADKGTSRKAAPKETNGTPAETKPNARDGRYSPLTQEIRDTFKVAFSDGPKTIVALGLDLKNMNKSFETRDLSEIESLLCEDPESYVSWSGRREGDKEPVTLWGSWEQFADFARARLDMSTFADTAVDLGTVSKHLGCSAAHARRAILEGRAT